MKPKKKVLIVTAPLNIGGFDIIATGLQMNLDKTRFECTYYIEGSEIGPLEPTVIKDGAKVIHRPDNVKGYRNRYKHLKKIMSDGNYDIVHSHLMFYSGLVMKAAAKCGIHKRIPHSHMTNPCMENRNIVQRAAAKAYSIAMKRWLNRYGTDLVACGPEAGAYLYGKRNFSKRGIILNNAIDVNRYKYNEKDRKQIRAEFGIEDCIVMGHVGRLNYVKNHKFLLDVFYELQKLKQKSKLLIVGDGEEKDNIIKKAENMGIKDNVIIAGVRRDVEKLLSAMDVFVFPSLYEGLPVTLIEAQATKLPCLISDSVSRYAKQNSNVEYISLNKAPKEWAEKALQLVKEDRRTVDTSKLMKDYDIKNIVRKLEEIYLW